MRRFVSALLFGVLGFGLASAQDNTVGLIQSDARTAGGYTLFAPLSSNTIYLIDIEGRLVHSWSSLYKPGNSVYLEADGTLLHTGNPGDGASQIFSGGAGGVVEELDWDGNRIWQFSYISDDVRAHHDVERLPSGNLLIIAWEYKTRAQAVQAGRDPGRLNQNALWPDHVIEVDRDENIVWQWHVWDHIVQDFDAARANYGDPADHPELIDINFPSGGNADLCHLNAVDYNAELDQIMLSSRTYSEIWIIDHSTTTEEAAGHSGGSSGRGGDLLYRWGNPAAYGLGTAADQKLFGQHDSQWIPDSLEGGGRILVFNNGSGRPAGNYSDILEFQPPLTGDGIYDRSTDQAFGPTAAAWHYAATPPTDFYGDHISGVQRLAGDNTLICEGPAGRFFEVTPGGETVWEYINPVSMAGILTQGDSPEGQKNEVFRCLRYAEDFAGFSGRDLTPGDVIEYDATAVKETENSPCTFSLGQNYPNPFNPTTVIPFTLNESLAVRLAVYNLAGKCVSVLLDGKLLEVGAHQIMFNGENLSSGVYWYRLSAGGWQVTGKMLLAK